MTQPPAHETRIAQHIAAPRHRVYAALLDPAAVRQWMVPDGMTSEIHAFDAREGGQFRISLTYDAPGATGKTSAATDTYHGHFAELVPDDRVIQVLAFETNDPAMQGEMTITYTLDDAPGGGTTLHSHHANLPPGIPPEDNATGTRISLAKLARLLEGG